MALGASTFVLRGRRGTYGTGLALVTRLGTQENDDDGDDDGDDNDDDDDNEEDE